MSDPDPRRPSGFVYHGLDAAPFRHLFDLDAAGLAAVHAVRVTADEPDAYPCRLTLEDAEPGAELILCNHTHLGLASPYAARGPVYVGRAGLDRGTVATRRVPGAIRRRLLSVRAYDGRGMMVAGEVVEGTALEPVLERLFTASETAFVHLHFARRGCYAARVERG